MLIQGINLQEIDAIIFDFGGVIIEVNMEMPYHKLLCLSQNPNDDLIKNLKNLAFSYEIGKINNQDFIDGIKSIIKLNLEDKEIQTIWNQMLGNVPSYMGKLLAHIKQEKRTFILSNTNPIHLEEAKRRFQESVKEYSFDSLFEKTYYSHEIGLHKPDHNIYSYVVKDSNLIPHRTLFIDDNYRNIEEAKKFGLQTILMNPPMSLESIIFI